MRQLVGDLAFESARGGLGPVLLFDVVGKIAFAGGVGLGLVWA